MSGKCLAIMSTQPMSGKKQLKRRSMSLLQKIQILDRLKNGERISSVAKSLNLNESTVRTFKKNEEKIRQTLADGCPLNAKTVTRARNINMIKMEQALMIWLEDCLAKNIPVSGKLIRQKALTFYNYLKVIGNGSEDQSFIASKGWLEKLKKRYSLHNIKFNGEPMNGDAESGQDLMLEISEILDERMDQPDFLYLKLLEKTASGNDNSTTEPVPSTSYESSASSNQMVNDDDETNDPRFVMSFKVEDATEPTAPTIFSSETYCDTSMMQEEKILPDEPPSPEPSRNSDETKVFSDPSTLPLEMYSEFPDKVKVPQSFSESYHPALEPLSWLFGSWKSLFATATFPTMQPVQYIDELSFTPTDKTFLKYKSETRHAVTQKMMHSEYGFLHILPSTTKVALNASHSFGLNENSEGEVCNNQLNLKSSMISRLGFVKNASVNQIERQFSLKGDILRVEVFIATSSHPLQKHLEAKFVKEKSV